MIREDFATEIRKLAAKLESREEAKTCPLPPAFDTFKPFDNLPSLRDCLDREYQRQYYGEVDIPGTRHHITESLSVQDWLNREVPPTRKRWRDARGHTRELTIVRIKVSMRPRVWRQLSIDRLEKDLFPLKYL
jgi:hypothetical protein